MSEKIVTLATLTYMRAQLLTAMLERNGIECFMTNVNRIKESPGGVNVKIMEDDAAEAVKVFEDFTKSYGKQKEDAVEYMKSIRRILVPVDFTEHAENAAFYAIKVAATLKADIKLINAYLDPMGTPQTYLESYTYQLNIDKVIREVEEESYKSLTAMANRLRAFIKENKIKDVKVRFDLFKGNAVDVILHEAYEYKPAMIIMGTRGSELDKFRSFGSVTSHLIEKTNIPVLAIPKDYDAKRIKTPKKVLYATDFDSTDYSALRRLVSFVKPFNAKIFCVHAALEESHLFDEVQMKRIRSYLFDTMDEYNIECGLLETMDIQQGLEDFIEERSIDVLAVTKQKRNFFTRLFKPSMTKKFLFQTHVPLLVFSAGK
jgi:nucleotide-binding universal stress UspA family protein